MMKQKTNKVLLNKQLKQIIEANDNVGLSLAFLEEKYHLTEDEKKVMKHIHLHLKNLNSIFTSMMK